VQEGLNLGGSYSQMESDMTAKTRPILTNQMLITATQAAEFWSASLTLGL